MAAGLVAKALISRWLGRGARWLACHGRFERAQQSFTWIGSK
jgi:hypothetical protein